jgi:hypothetical protein
LPAGEIASPLGVEMMSACVTGGPWRSVAAAGGTTPGRTRTCNPQFRRLSPDCRKLESFQNVATNQKSLAPSLPHDPPTDPDLDLIVERWADLPLTVRAGIVAMVKASEPSPRRTRKGQGS